MDAYAVRAGTQYRQDPRVRGADVIEIFVNGKIRHIGIDITDPDSYAATRRAIVRAAAEIGKTL